MTKKKLEITMGSEKFHKDFCHIVKWFRLGICFGSPLPPSVSLSPYIHPPSTSQYFMYWGKMRRKVISVYYILIENSTSTTSFCLQQSKRRDSQEFWLHFTVFEYVQFNLKFTEKLYKSLKIYQKFDKLVFTYLMK